MEKKENSELNKKPMAWACFSFGLLMCLLFSIEASRQNWPPLDGDGAILFPPAVEISMGRDLKSPVWVWPLDESIDGPCGRRLVNHGFVYQLLIGHVASVFGGGTVICYWILHSLNLLAAAVCGAAILGSISTKWPFRPAISFLIPIQMFALLEAWPGRPEPLIMLLLGVGLLLSKVMSLSSSWIFWAGIVPIMFFTSPACGVVAVLIFAAESVFLPSYGKKKTLILAGSAMVLSIFGILTVYPYSLENWLSGIWATGRIALSAQPFEGFINSWIKQTDHPFFLITLLAPLYLAAIKIIKKTSVLEKKHKIFFWFCFGLCGIILFRIAFVKAEALYNIAVFLPLLWTLCWQGKPQLISAVLITLSGLPLVVAFVWKSLILIARSQAEPIKFEELQLAVNKKISEGLVIPPVFYFACPRPWSVRYFDAKNKTSLSEKWLFAKQVNTGLLSPQDLPGFTLVENRFGSPLTIFGFPISNTPKGWEYAVFKKQNKHETD